MGEPAIPVAVVALFVFLFSVVAYRRAQALRTRGIRTEATCVNSRNGEKGNTYLLVRFTSDTGALLETGLGPFQWPPVAVGGALDVVYDPKDTSNVVLPDAMSNGRKLLAFATGSGVLLLLCLVVMLVDFAG
ncbi:DUF3592 domain-containing protein [Streptomyces sp. NPDC101175]|uniref:DUF3592 domain-containing protein n=1 Tax=Streptomyces sp. NPDC101175 TaxID=3366123 RepID=UPI0038338901